MGLTDYTIISVLDDNHSDLLILLDSFKAFDTIDISLSVLHYEYIGLDESATALLNSYYSRQKTDSES